MRKQEHPIDKDKVADRMVDYLKHQDRQKREGEDELWQLVSAEIEKEEQGEMTSAPHPAKNKRIYWIAVSLVAAASVLCFLFLGKAAFMNENSMLEEYVSQLSDEVQDVKQVQLLLSDHEKVSMDKDSVGIVYDSDGSIRIDKDVREKSDTDKEDESDFNQIIVPKGKYTFITLSDGTKMHVNSGTRVIYPRVFTGSNREIYVEGEVFLNVTKNPQKPFIVRTSQCDVQVLGTSFNVSAYKEEIHAEVVLVEGSVKLKDKQSNEIWLKPDNLVTVNSGKAGSVRNVNAADYCAWINGMLISRSETLQSIFNKLSRFYDQPIVVSSAISHEMLDGKLDLRQSLPELIRLISVAVPIEYKETNGVFHIYSPKEK